MNLTATQKNFQTPRVTASIGFRAWLGEFRAWLEQCAEGSWIDKIREGSRPVIDALLASLHAWRPLESEHARKAMDRLAKVYDRCDAIVWRVGDLGAVAFWRIYDRCDPALSKLYDSCAPALERAAHGFREIAERAAARRDLTLVAVVVGLPAVSFLLFAAAHWLADDGPAAEGFAGGTSAYTLHDPHIRISTTLVEPPALAGRVPAAAPTTPAPPLAKPDGQALNEGAAGHDGKADDIATLISAISDQQADVEPRNARPAAADGQRPSAESAVLVAALPPSESETPSPTVNSPAVNSEDPSEPLFPFTTPRPRPSRAADTASLTPSTGVAGAAPKPDRPAGDYGMPGTFYRIQLAAVRDRDQALSLWESLNRTDSDLLGALEPDISTRTTRKNQPIYRLRAGPLNSRTDAEALCSALESRKVDCLVIKDSG